MQNLEISIKQYNMSKRRLNTALIVHRKRTMKNLLKFTGLVKPMHNSNMVNNEFSRNSIDLHRVIARSKVVLAVIYTNIDKLSQVFGEAQ